MPVIRHVFVAVLALVISVASAQASPILIVNGGGILTGATGVDVGGTLYDVEFVDGTCAAIFTGCDQLSDFTFTTELDVRAAGLALLDQVFLDTAAGSFDSDPELTNGCTDVSTCRPYAPFEINGFGFAAVAAANDDQLFENTYFGISQDSSYATGANEVWARWTPSADTTPVPEPTSLTLLGLGLAGMAGRRWRQRKRPSTGTESASTSET